MNQVIITDCIECRYSGCAGLQDDEIVCTNKKEYPLIALVSNNVKESTAIPDWCPLLIKRRCDTCKWNAAPFDYLVDDTMRTDHYEKEHIRDTTGIVDHIPDAGKMGEK